MTKAKLKRLANVGLGSWLGYWCGRGEGVIIAIQACNTGKLPYGNLVFLFFFQYSFFLFHQPMQQWESFVFLKRELPDGLKPPNAPTNQALRILGSLFFFLKPRM